jgi:hypothetical protein
MSGEAKLQMDGYNQASTERGGGEKKKKLSKVPASL